MDTSFKLEITGDINEKIDIVRKIEEHLKSIKELSVILSSKPITVSTKEVLLKSI